MSFAQIAYLLCAHAVGLFRRGRRFDVYTDASVGPRGAGYAAVILWRNGPHRCRHQISGRVKDPAMLRCGSVGAEFDAVMRAVQFCERKQAATIVLHHDFVGVGDWPFRRRRRRRDGLRIYSRFMQRRLTVAHLRRGGAPIFFRKIKAHSGNRFNTLADRLAGDAAA